MPRYQREHFHVLRRLEDIDDRRWTIEEGTLNICTALLPATGRIRETAKGQERLSIEFPNVVRDDNREDQMGRHCDK